MEIEREKLPLSSNTRYNTGASLSPHRYTTAILTAPVTLFFVFFVLFLCFCVFLEKMSLSISQIDPELGEKKYNARASLNKQKTSVMDSKFHSKSNWEFFKEHNTAFKLLVVLIFFFTVFFPLLFYKDLPLSLSFIEDLSMFLILSHLFFSFFFFDM